MSDPVNARLVDERDTQWEADRQDYRVFVVHDEDGWEVYDIDDQTLPIVQEWAARKTTERPGARYSIAIRIVDDHGRGLLWLTPDPDDPDAAARNARTLPDDPTIAVAES